MNEINYTESTTATDDNVRSTTNATADYIAELPVEGLQAVQGYIEKLQTRLNRTICDIRMKQPTAENQIRVETLQAVYEMLDHETVQVLTAITTTTDSAEFELMRIILFLFKLFFPNTAARQNPPAVAAVRRQLQEIEGKIELQLGLRYGVYSIADAQQRHRRLDEIAQTIHTLRENREQLRRQLGETCRAANGHCCFA